MFSPRKSYAGIADQFSEGQRTMEGPIGLVAIIFEIKRIAPLLRSLSARYMLLSCALIIDCGWMEFPS